MPMTPNRFRESDFDDYDYDEPAMTRAEADADAAAEEMAERYEEMAREDREEA